MSYWVTVCIAIALVPHHKLTIFTCRFGHTWPGGRDSEEQVSSLTVPLRSVSHREKWECNEMAAAHINTEEGWSITSVTPAFLLKHLLRLSTLGPSPRPRLPSGLLLYAGKIPRRFPSSEC